MRLHCLLPLSSPPARAFFSATPTAGRPWPAGLHAGEGAGGGGLATLEAPEGGSARRPRKARREARLGPGAAAAGSTQRSDAKGGGAPAREMKGGETKGEELARLG